MAVLHSQGLLDQVELSTDVINASSHLTGIVCRVQIGQKTSCGSFKKRGTTSGAKLNTVCDEFHHRSRPDRRIMRLGVCERRQLLPVVLPTYETTKSPFENGITYRNGIGPLSFLVVGSGYTMMDSGNRC